MFEKLPLLTKKALAWSVHLFTATGAIWGLLTLLAIFEQRWRMAIMSSTLSKRTVEAWMTGGLTKDPVRLLSRPRRARRVAILRPPPSLPDFAIRLPRTA